MSKLPGIKNQNTPLIVWCSLESGTDKVLGLNQENLLFLLERNQQEGGAAV